MLKTWFAESGDTHYQCPHCNTEIADYTGDELESGSTHCGHCGEEFYLDIAE